MVMVIVNRRLKKHLHVAKILSYIVIPNYCHLDPPISQAPRYCFLLAAVLYIVQLKINEGGVLLCYVMCTRKPWLNFFYL